MKNLIQDIDRYGVAVGLLSSNRAANQLDLHGLLSSHCVCSDQAKMSSTDLPRLAATSDGVVQLRSASSVARTML